MVPYNQMKSNQLPPYIKLRNADGTEDIHYSLLYEGVPNEFKTIPRKELNETEEKRRMGIQKLRDILKDEVDGTIPGVDDYMLTCVLRYCKYDPKKYKKALFKYLKVRKMTSEKLEHTDIKKIEQVLDHFVIGLLPYRDKRGRAIYFTTPNIDLNLFTLDDAYCCYYVIILFILSFPMTSINGIAYIGEAKTPKLDILYPVMKSLRQELENLQSFPARTSRIEVLNEIFIVRWTLNILKPFLTAKHLERITFYGSNISNLQKIYHPQLLPEEFSGNMGPLSNNFYKEEILNFIKKLKSENNL